MGRNIFLIGFMGTGKTTIAQQLAQRLDFTLIDIDREIENKAERTITQIFSEYGEAYFRMLETEVIASCRMLEDHIAACGGGAVLNRKNVDHMRQSGQILLLTARPETILDRIKGNSKRPLLEGKMNLAYIKEMLLQRSEAYEYAADYSIVTDEKEPEELVKEILHYMEAGNYES